MESSPGLRLETSSPSLRWLGLLKIVQPPRAGRIAHISFLVILRCLLKKAQIEAVSQLEAELFPNDTVGQAFQETADTAAYRNDSFG